MTEDSNGTKMNSQPRPVIRRINSIGMEALPTLDNYTIRLDKETGNVVKKLSTRPTMEQLLEGKSGSPDEADLTLSNKQKKDLEAGKEATDEPSPGKIIKFGWIQGVYMRCLLNIWGVMLFLRLTWVIGQCGLIEGILVITLSNIVTVVTTISMSAVSTNGQISAGGIYYMISRSLGPEFGGAIGLMFTLANSIAVSMYTIGFCESLIDMLFQYIPGFEGIVDAANRTNDVRLIGTITLILVLALAIVGMEWVTRVQLLLLGLLLVSQVDFIVGTFLTPSALQLSKGFVGYDSEVFTENIFSNYTTDPITGKSESFFTVFAVFFPAVTGIVAGANLSGDLKDPGVAIPRGTLLAIVTTYVSYIVYGCMVAGCSVRYASGVAEKLISGPQIIMSFTSILNITQGYDDCSGRMCEYGISINQQMMEVISAWGPLIYAGCFAATISSAIASLVGAPRVFQAVAKDKLFPYIDSFSRGYGANNDPVRGYILVFIISLVCILIGDLNVVSSLLSNFFVAAYALINFSVFHADITNSPGWRPSFRYYNKWISLIGTILCVAVMFLMDYITALITFICIGCLYFVVKVRATSVNWGSSTQSQSFMLALQSVQALSKVPDHVKNYRPKILLISGNPGGRPILMDFASLITKKVSLLQCVRVVDNDLDLKQVENCKDIGEKWLRSNKVKGFFHVTRSESLSGGVRTALELCGLGKMSPNMLLFGFKSNWKEDYVSTEAYFKTLVTVFDNKMALGILRVHGGMDASELYGNKKILDMLTKKDGDSSDEETDTDTDSCASSNPVVEEEEVSDVPSGQGVRKGSNAMPLFPGPFFKNPLQKENQEIVAKMQQFRGKEPKEGPIDIYWLYDDGGLSLLLPHLIQSQPKFSKSPLRVFFLSRSDNVIFENHRMADMISKFRIDVERVELLRGIDNPPTVESEKVFNNMLHHASSRARKLSVKAGTSHEPKDILMEADEVQNRERTLLHLRLGEMIREKSKDSALIVMTLPLPTKGVTPYPLYMAWLDFVSRDLPPFMFIRGNQESVLTFYS